MPDLMQQKKNLDNKIGKELIGKFVRVEFLDHFRFDKISKKKIQLNLKRYARNSAVGNVIDVRDDFLVLASSWGEAHDSIAGIAVYIPAIICINALSGPRRRS